MDLKSTYNKIAEDWFKDHDADTWWMSGTDKFLSFLKPESRILDIGCGAGQKSRYIHKFGFDVTGIDFSEEMIRVAKRQAPDIHFEVGDIYETDKLPYKFDAVFAQAVLLHIPKSRIAEVISKLKSLLNKDGLLYVAVKEKGDGYEDGILTENDYGYEYERFFSYFKMNELQTYFKEAGLEIIWDEITSSGKTNWLQIIGKNI